MLFRSKLRLSGFGVVKLHYRVTPGDVLTFPQARHIRVVKVLALGSRRGPASEAQDLYEDLKPPAFETRLPSGTPDALASARREPGARSEERRVWKERGRTCSSWWSPSN